MKNSGISRHGIGRLLLMLGQETWMDIKVLKRQGLSQRAIARETPGKTYNSDNQRSNTGFSYDGNGNPTTYSTNAAVFDVENRMSSYGSSFTAGYDSLDIRAWSKSGSTTTYYLYADNPTLPICELNSSGTVTATNTFTFTGLVSRNTSSGSTFYEFDPQGTVAERLNSAGSCTVSSVADASGGIANSGTVSDPFGYIAQAGYYTDRQTGLILTTFRYYDPSNGRFINRDPARYRGGINLYGYTHNNFESLVDPFGEDGWFLWPGWRSPIFKLFNILKNWHLNFDPDDNPFVTIDGDEPEDEFCPLERPVPGISEEWTGEPIGAIEEGGSWTLGDGTILSLGGDAAAGDGTIEIIIIIIAL
jgi:RHS repeat-associated protein